MKSKYLIILLLFAAFNLYSNNKILLVTNEVNTYNTYLKEINKNIDKIVYDVEVIMVDDDYTNNDFSGSENYLKDKWADPPLFTYYINNDTKKRTMIYGFNRKSQPNLEIVKVVLKKLFLESRVSKEFPLYLTNIIPEKIVTKIYRESGYSVLLIEGLNNPDNIIETLYIATDQTRIETHYFIIPFLGKTLYLTGKFLLITNGVALFIIILLLNIFSKRLNFHLRHNRKYLITIPIKIIALFIFYFISTLILEYVQTLPGGSGIILKYPRTFFLLKNLILFFIYGICFQIIRDVSISKSPYFYENFSLYGTIFVYLILTVIYQPLALYQLWPILMTMLFIISSNKKNKRIFLIISPIFMVLIFYNFLNSEYLIFADLMLSSKYMGNIILTIFLIPYIFLQESYFRFNHRKQNKITYTKDIILSLLTITITFTTIAILLEINNS